MPFGGPQGHGDSRADGEARSVRVTLSGSIEAAVVATIRKAPMDAKSLNLGLVFLVEAAGVEPASEKVRRVKPTCVSGSGVFNGFL